MVGWLILVGMFLIVAFVTYGIFANVADARREQELAAQGATPVAAGEGKLSAKLVEELRAVAAGGGSAEAWLKGTRVPYGYCLATKECDKRTRCVQCDSFETAEEDIPALRLLLSQELDLARLADERGLGREGEIHRSIAASIQRHLSKFDLGTEVA